MRTLILRKGGGDVGGAEAVAQWLHDVQAARGLDVEIRRIDLRQGRAAWRAVSDARRFDVVHAHHRHAELLTRAAVPRNRRFFTLHQYPTRLAGVQPSAWSSCPSRVVIERLGWRGITHIPSPLLARWTGSERQEPRLLFVGRVTAAKGWSRWLTVLAGVRERHPDVVGVVHGDGPDLAAMREEARRRDLPVDFRGWCAPSEIEAGHGDVLLVTSEAEADPLMALEAAAARVPVVATPVGDLALDRAAWRLAATDKDLVDGCLDALEGDREKDASVRRALEVVGARAPELIADRYLRWFAHATDGPQ